MKPAKSALVTGTRSIQERRQLGRMARALIVVGEAAGISADHHLAARHVDHLRALGHGLGARARVARGRLVALDHLEELKHRLVVLVLVGDQKLVDEAVAKQRVIGALEVDPVQHVERALPHLVHVGAQLVTAEDRKLVAGAPRVLDRVVEAAELAVHRLPPADGLHQPELLEVRDVAEVPGERAQDRRVGAIQLFVRQGLDEHQRSLACLGKSRGDPIPAGGGGQRDVRRLPAGARES